MKKIFLAGLLAMLSISTFSFMNVNGPSRTGSEQKAFKKYTAVVSSTIQLPGNCSLTVYIVISFWWNGPGTPITNIEVISAPTFQLTCPPNALVEARSEITNISFNSETGHCTAIEFEATDNGSINDAIDDPDVKQEIIDEINDQVDNQD